MTGSTVVNDNWKFHNYYKPQHVYSDCYADKMDTVRLLSYV